MTSTATSSKPLTAQEQEVRRQTLWEQRIALQGAPQTAAFARRNATLKLEQTEGMLTSSRRRVHDEQDVRLVALQLELDYRKAVLAAADRWVTATTALRAQQ